MMHTQGPWHVGFRSGANGNMVMTYNGIDQYEDASICQVYGLPMNCSLKEIEMTSRNKEGLANARLIAAAPELLEALERAEDMLNYALGCINPEMSASKKDVQRGIQDICAAIKKAKDGR